MLIIRAQRTSAGSAKVGMADVGIGGSVYTMKSAMTPAAAVSRRSPTFANMFAKVAATRLERERCCCEVQRWHAQDFRHGPRLLASYQTVAAPHFADRGHNVLGARDPWGECGYAMRSMTARARG
jgi:hypothetical protein